MKHAVIAAILLALCIAFLIFASVYADISAEILIACAESDDTDALRCEFDARERVLSLFIHNRLLENAETALIGMETFSKDTAEYRNAKETFKAGMREMIEDMLPGIRSVF